MGEHNQCFESFQTWVNKASSWLTRHPRYNGKDFRAACYDAKHRRCHNGGDFMRARDEGAFPVRWYWPDQQIDEPVLAEMMAARAQGIEARSAETLGSAEGESPVGLQSDAPKSTLPIPNPQSQKQESAA